jgi:hypothetical protein
MVDEGAVAEVLRNAVRPFGAPVVSVPALRWGRLFAALDGEGGRAGAESYVTAIELIYEGYLLHYRQSRVCGREATVHETALLAGDCLYACGLRLIASRGDAEAVGLLARLMSACSYLRSVRAPFADDDALWAYTMSGLAALRRGVAATTAATLFEQLDGALAEGELIDLQALAPAVMADLGRAGWPDQALATDSGG